MSMLKFDPLFLLHFAKSGLFLLFCVWHFALRQMRKVKYLALSQFEKILLLIYRAVKRRCICKSGEEAAELNAN